MKAIGFVSWETRQSRLQGESRAHVDGLQYVEVWCVLTVTLDEFDSITDGLRYEAGRRSDLFLPSMVVLAN